MPDEPKIDVNAVKNAENSVRDLKNWVAVFSQEYELPEEAVDKLNEKVEEIAKKIGAISCK